MVLVQFMKRRRITVALLHETVRLVFFQIQMTKDSVLTKVITPSPDSTDGRTEWHRTGERQFIISVNDSWSIWALAECDVQDIGKLSYSFNITPLPAPECEPLSELSTCNEYYNTAAMPNRIGVISQSSMYGYFEFGLQYVYTDTMCHQHLKFFLCQYAYPRCTEVITNENSTQTLVDMPCRQFCDEVYVACEEEFVTVGRYLAILVSKCELLPDQREQPDCLLPIVDCKQPPQSTAGEWSFRNTTLHNKAALQCDTGFFLRGTGEIKCDYSGEWTQSEAECIPIDDNTRLYVGIAFVCMVVVLLIVALPLVYKCRYEINVLLYNRFRFRFRKQRENAGKQYDAFIAYNVKVLHTLLS